MEAFFAYPGIRVEHSANLMELLCRAILRSLGRYTNLAIESMDLIPNYVVSCSQMDASYIQRNGYFKVLCLTCQFSADIPIRSPFYTLPDGYRPRKRVKFVMPTYWDNLPCTISILPNGNVISDDILKSGIWYFFYAIFM